MMDILIGHLQEDVAKLTKERDAALGRVEVLEDEKKTLLLAVEVDDLEYQCLKNAGVDNWGGYEQAMDEYWKITLGESKEGEA